jgi:glycosyltransferase involved in cell wall biosynthesis
VLAERIRLLLTQPRLRAALGSTGLSLVRTRYHWDRIAAETESVYDRVRGPRPAVRGSAVSL